MLATLTIELCIERAAHLSGMLMRLSKCASSANMDACTQAQVLEQYGVLHIGSSVVSLLCMHVALSGMQMN